jgi:hypothetical protein
MAGGEKTRTGGCLCGAVRVSVTGPPSSLNFCHCRTCRKASGAPVVAWATFPLKAVKFEGKPVWFKSSERAERAFCPRCGSAMCWREFAHPDMVDLTTITFDEPEDPELKPKDHLWMDARVRWLRIEDGLPRYHEGRKGPRLEN